MCSAALETCVVCMDAEGLFHTPFSGGRTGGHMVDAERWDLSDQRVWQVPFLTGCHVPWKDWEAGASLAVLKGCRGSPAPLRMLLGTGDAELSAWAQHGPCGTPVTFRGVQGLVAGWQCLTFRAVSRLEAGSAADGDCSPC